MSDILDGKTIERVETEPPDPYNGAPDDSRLVLYFTDGTTVEIVGGGDDCDDWLEVNDLDDQELAKRLSLAAEHNAKVQEQREKRRAWLALTCEQRQAELAKQPKRLAAFDSVISTLYVDFLTESLTAWNPTPEHTIKTPCPKCRERECPNAPTKLIPAKPGLSEATSISFDRRTKARRN